MAIVLFLVVSVIGEEFQVNTYTTEAQHSPAICAGENGTVAVVWVSEFQDGSRGGVYGRILGRDGAFLSDEFQVSTYTRGDQTAPAIACELDGDFIVVWANTLTRSALGHPIGGHIWGRRFASSGTPLGPEFQISHSEYSKNSNAAVAKGPGGAFVVAWQENFDYQILARSFDAQGEPMSGQFVVSSNRYCIGEEPRVAWTSTGSLVFAWETRECEEGVSSRRFSPFGQPLDDTLSLHRADANAMGGVCAGPAGDFTVAWSSSNYTDYVLKTFARTFDRDGEPKKEFVVRESKDYTSPRTHLACDDDGGFIVAWSSGDAILGTSYDPQGKPSDVVLAPGDSIQRSEPAVVSFGSGELMAVWTSMDQDGDRAGIFGRSLASAVPTFTPEPTPTPTPEQSSSGGCAVRPYSCSGLGAVAGILALILLLRRRRRL